MIARTDRVVLDLGTGDGRAVLARARREPTALIVGVDAVAAAMAESSLRAARPARKGGQPNVLYVVAAAEQPAVELAGRVDELSILFPWGSLLRGTLALAVEPATGIATLLAPGGAARALVSVDARDRLELPDDALALEKLAIRWAAHGLRVTCLRPATTDEIAASGSTWARRLDAARRRDVCLLELRRCRVGRPRPPARPTAARRGPG